jgi:hypothetical protein
MTENMDVSDISAARQYRTLALGRLFQAQNDQFRRLFPRGNVL